MIFPDKRKLSIFNDNTKYSRNDLKLILDHYKLVNDKISLTINNKFLLPIILMNTMVGNYFIDRKYSIDKIIQKDIRKIEIPLEINEDLYFKLHKISILLNEGNVDRLKDFKSTSVFKFTNALYIQELGLLKKDSRFDFITDLKEMLNIPFKEIDLKFSEDFFEKITDPDNKIRNLYKLMVVRIPELKEIFEYNTFSYIPKNIKKDFQEININILIENNEKDFFDI